MWDTKKEVGVQALATITKGCTVIGNNDIEPFIPHVISAIKNPSEITECVYKLAGTTFVQVVEAPALALMVPILLRGYRENATATKRLCSVIADNMLKLVDDPITTGPFLLQLVPENLKLQDTSDPECRKTAKKTDETLERLVEDGKKAAVAKADPVTTEKLLKDISSAESKVKPNDFVSKIFAHVANSACAMVDTRVFATEAWTTAVKPFMEAIDAASADKVCSEFTAKCIKDLAPKGAAAAAAIARVACCLLAACLLLACCSR